MAESESIRVRAVDAPRDVDRIVERHGAIYRAEQGFDDTFRDYVRAPLEAAVQRGDPRERVWIAEDGNGRFLGCAAIVAATLDAAQLRWYLVDPAARGRGLGTRLLDAAVEFAAEQGYATIVLWTVRALTDAARRYAAAGFRLVETKPGRMWGVDVIEERWER